jgi:Cft2 family RNA processing exonuclease
MTEDQIKKLKYIREYLIEGNYTILQKPQWNEFSKDLSNCGGNLLRDIEQKRDEVRKVKISPFSFFKGGQLKKLYSEYAEVARNFDLFFDSSMRFLKSIIDGNIYEEYQILTKNYVEKLVEHCHQASNYLGNLISAKRNDYYHYQALFYSVIAIVVSMVSLMIGLIIR